MKQRFTKLAALAGTVLATVIGLPSCKEDAIIKSSLTPAVDNIHTFGIGSDYGTANMPELAMDVSTGYQDSLITSQRKTGLPIYHALGYVHDPFAGNTAAGIFMQFVPTAVNTTITGTLDSIVLVLPYAGFTWGDTVSSIQHTYRVYAITGSFSKDTNYYSKSNLPVDPTPIGVATITTGSSLVAGNIQDSSIALGKNAIRRAPHLRIKLDPAFYTRFQALLAADSTYPDFTKAFPGLYIAPDTSTGKASLPFFRLSSAGSDLYGTAALLAYSNGSDTATQFIYSEDYAAHFNRITRNYAGTGILSLFSGGTDQYLALQNDPGAYIDLKLPYIQNLPANVLIVKAEIAFTQVQAPGMPANDDKIFFGPNRFYPNGINSTGGRYDIADFYAGSSIVTSFVDGAVTTETRGGTTVNVYRVNIPREIQKTIVAQNGGLHLRIGGTINYPGAYRLVVGGPGHPNPLYRPTINIIYSKQ